MTAITTNSSINVKPAQPRLADARLENRIPCFIAVSTSSSFEPKSLFPNIPKTSVALRKRLAIYRGVISRLTIGPMPPAFVGDGTDLHFEAMLPSSLKRAEN